MSIEFIYPEFEVIRNENRCITCRICQQQCANGVHSYNSETKQMVCDESNCVNCQRCVSFCPTRALKIVKSDCSLRENANWSENMMKEIYKQANSGGVLLSSMGNPNPLPVYWDRILINASQVTNPPIDPLREPMETRIYLGKKPEQVHRMADGSLDCELPPQLELSMPVMFSAMSYGSISYNAHKSLALAAKELGILYNTGEGGLHEDFYCYGENTIVQVASGRFGVHEKYLNAGAGIEIKMGQGAKPGMLYKYKIRPAAGGEADHCDPYGFWMELRPGSASALWPLGGYRFTDEAWMAARSRAFDAPVNIYEMHFGSWKKDEARENGWYRYDEIADKLIAHVKENGYNYIEFMPLSEHPADCSWGYQNTGFFAPTSRYGTPDQLKELIDKCHAAGIGVLLDFVPVHFALDAYALANYDGTALYEYPHSDVGVSEWGSCNFMHSRGEVCSFLQSAAHYWLEEFHFDGLRMDAISRMIYWQGDPARGVNGNAVSFLQTMNAGLRRLHPTAMLIAEDSTNFPKVTAPVEYGGLGFDYKWDLGWMNDTLDYFKKTPEERRAQYHKLTFSMAYFPQEQYLLPLSHDEVVHGKAAIVQKMYGDYEQKFPQARALYLYMMAHPGKKLNFMGSELGHMREWDEARELDWMLLQYPIHDAFRHFTEELNRLYLSNDAFWQSEYDPAHFQWLDCQADGTCLYAFLRRGGTHTVAAAFNFGDTPAPSYRLHMPFACRARVLLHTEWQRFGGALPEETPAVRSRAAREGHVLTFPVPAFSGLVLELDAPDGSRMTGKPNQ